MDGKQLAAASALRQSHVSIMSLLLVTAFRATVVAILGVCFTQYLWYTLHGNCLRIGVIEDLFQSRANILNLFNVAILRQAPVLFLATTLSWLVPLATIYPPSALTIQSELHMTSQIVNAPVMNPAQIYNHTALPSVAKILDEVKYRSVVTY